MSVRSDQAVTKRLTRAPRKTHAAKPRVQANEWKLADDRLDEALRQTFPASDALSIVQVASGS
jgi:hypothetical protein